MEIFTRKTYGSENKKIVFLLSGWCIKQWMMWYFAKQFERNGYQCIVYTYENNVFSPDTKKTVNDLLRVRDDVLDRIKQLKEQECKDFNIFGASLGTIIALLVANKSSDISRIILNTTGSDIAEVVWSWDNVKKYFKNALISQGYSLVQLKKDWSVITPINNINNLKNKKILLFLSQKDELIPYKLGEALGDVLSKYKYDVQIRTNIHSAHLLSGILNLFNTKVYLKFLNAG